MQDIALAVGAKYFSEKTGDDLSLITPNDLGHANKIIEGQQSTVILKENIVNNEIQKRIAELKVQQEYHNRLKSKNIINERIASLSGGIVVFM